MARYANSDHATFCDLYLRCAYLLKNSQLVKMAVFQFDVSIGDVDHLTSSQTYICHHSKHDQTTILLVVTCQTNTSVRNISKSNTICFVLIANMSVLLNASMSVHVGNVNLLGSKPLSYLFNYEEIPSV